VIDDHTHQFPLEFAPLVLEGIALDLGQDEAAAARRRSLAPGRLYLHLLEVRLAALLGVDLPDAVPARDDRAARDWVGWLRMLFDDAAITGMVMDEPLNEPGNVGEYADAAGRPVWSMGRIDPVVDDLLADGATAAEIVASVEIGGDTVHFAPPGPVTEIGSGCSVTASSKVSSTFWGAAARLAPSAGELDFSAA